MTAKEISSNTSDISNLKTQQGTDVTNISSNTNDIKNVKTQQATDVSNIAMNTSNISQLQTIVNGKVATCQVVNGGLQCTYAQAKGTNDVAAGNGALANGTSSIAIGTNATATYNGAVAIGDGARAVADPATAIGSNAQANANNSTAIGANSTANGINSVALGQGSTANRANSVSVGNASTGLTRQITNVAPGTTPNDVATVGQLQGAVGQAQHYAAQVGSVNAAALNAAASAASGQGPNTVAGGYGEYDGQSAFAFTYQHRFKCNWQALLTVGSNGSGKNTEVGAGASYSW
ncbi:MAG: YadA family autotransporter adhesin [Acidithiobacillus sp.]